MKGSTLTAVQLSRFMGRLNPFAIQLKSGAYAPIHRKITFTDLEKHINGTETYGTYVIREDGNINFIIIDIDGKETDDMKWWRAIADMVMDEFQEFDRCLEFSGRRGYHIWLFLDQPEKPRFYRELVKTRFKKLGLRNIEIYPKQNKINTLDKQLGSLIKLPGGIHKKSNKRSEIIEWRLK
jgi:hypothetical protein